MPYQEQTWITGETITAEKLNHMENGIDNVYDLIFYDDDENTKLVGISYNEIESYIASNQLIVCCIAEKHSNDITGGIDYNSYVIKFTYSTDESGEDTVATFTIKNSADKRFIFNKKGTGKIYESSTLITNFTWTYNDSTHEYTITLAS